MRTVVSMVVALSASTEKASPTNTSRKGSRIFNHRFNFLKGKGDLAQIIPVPNKLELSELLD